MAEGKKLDWQTWLVVIGLLAFFVIEGTRIGMGHTADLKNAMVRLGFVLGSLFWAILFESMKEDDRFTYLFGAGEIVVGGFALWYQLTKLGETGWQQTGGFERCAFILGSVVLLSKGMKDFFPFLDLTAEA